MITVKISRPNGEVVDYFLNPANVEYAEHFIKVTDDRGNVYNYSYSYLIEVEEWVHRNELYRK